MQRSNRNLVLAKRPITELTDDNFELKEAPIPIPGSGQLLIKVLYLSVDPTQRSWLNEEKSYIQSVALGETMPAWGVGQIICSRHGEFENGDFVMGLLGWQDYVVSDADGPIAFEKVSTNFPLTYYLSIFGLTTLTAYFGLLYVGALKKADTVLVSGAAGATGSMAAQIAKIKGARVIGIAGGSEKCRWLLNKVGVDHAIDYKNESVERRIKESCPNGVDVFFDNVGGPILDAALNNLAFGARVIVCGIISSGYGSFNQDNGLKNYMNLILRSARMEGFLTLNYSEKFGEAMIDLRAWVEAGKVYFEEDIVEGLENAPASLQGLFAGENIGKRILKVANNDTDIVPPGLLPE